MMQNYISRIPFLFAIQNSDDFERTQENVVSLTSSDLSYRDPVTCDSQEEQTVEDQQREIDPETKLSLYSLNEVSYHDNFDDCWIILYDRVYDITNFLQEHPGGEDVLMEYAGRDATISFRSVGHSHAALKSLEDFIIGILPNHQRLFPTECENRWSIL